MTEVTIGIDIGTTSVKGVAVDGDGRILARARVPHRVSTPEADRLDPLRVFQDSAARERLLAPAFGKFVQCDPAKPQRGVAPRKLLGFMPIALPGRTGPARTALISVPHFAMKDS